MKVKITAGNVDKGYAAEIDMNIPEAELIAKKEIDRNIYNTPEKYGDQFNKVFHREMDKICFEKGIRKTTRFH